MGLGSGGGGVPDSPAGNPPRRHGASCPEHPASVLQAERCPFLTSAEGHRPGPSRAHAPHGQRPRQPHTRTPVSISKPHPNVPRGPLREEPPEPPQRDGEPRALAGQVSERALRLAFTHLLRDGASLSPFIFCFPCFLVCAFARSSPDHCHVERICPKTSPIGQDRGGARRPGLHLAARPRPRASIRHPVLVCVRAPGPSERLAEGLRRSNPPVTQLGHHTARGWGLSDARRLAWPRLGGGGRVLGARSWPADRASHG